MGGSMRKRPDPFDQRVETLANARAEYMLLAARHPKCSRCEEMETRNLPDACHDGTRWRGVTPTEEVALRPRNPRDCIRCMFLWGLEMGTLSAVAAATAVNAKRGKKAPKVTAELVCRGVIRLRPELASGGWDGPFVDALRRAVGDGSLAELLRGCRWPCERIDIDEANGGLDKDGAGLVVHPGGRKKPFNIGQSALEKGRTKSANT